MSASKTSIDGEEIKHDIIDGQQTTCCVVGGGPAGVVLAFLLARQGIPVMLLEAHQDFDRDFRGDTIHPSVMEIMAELGLADRLLQLPHTKVSTLTLMGDGNAVIVADLSRLKTNYPYITFMPQVRFLEFITEEAKQYPSFQLVMGANVQELIEEDGEVRGVRYRGHGGWHEVRSLLTVAADGRHSKLRQLAHLEPIACRVGIVRDCY
jgi:2-polyprenyl-6-methoxyphenol hydroxylase-like FAD-dependent oxidoreductase